MDKRLIFQKTETEKAVQQLLEQRWQLGRMKYGEGISYKQRSTNMQWLDNAIEEAADMLQYLVAFKLKLQNKKSKVKKRDRYNKIQDRE